MRLRTQPNQALQRTAAGRRGCYRRARLVAAVAELGSLDRSFPHGRHNTDLWR